MSDMFEIDFSRQTISTCFHNHYIVPDYQREYVWSRTEVEQLLTDLEDAFRDDSKKEYFLGSIVTYKANNCYE